MNENVSSGASSYYLEDGEDYFRALRKQGMDDSFSEEAKENGRWWARHFNSLREYELYKFCNELPTERTLEGVDITT